MFSFSRCCYLIFDLSFHLFGWESGPRLSRSHLDSAVELSCLDSNSLGHSAHRFLAIAQRFVHLTAYPQPMQQYCQLSCRAVGTVYSARREADLVRQSSSSQYLLDFYRADLNDWLAIGVVGDVADNFLRLRPPRLNKCVDGLEVKVPQGEISRRRARNGPSNSFFNGDTLRIEPRSR